MLELISGPWHWSISGAAIAAVMFALLYAGKEFGFSSNLRTMCTIAGAGERYEFFDIDWRAQRWNLTFAAGAILGGFLAFYVFPNPDPLVLSTETATYLEGIGIDTPGPEAGKSSFVPMEFYASEQLLTLPGFIVLIIGGFLIGFGTRWAGGCTSGHAISGLANLQLPSLIAVIGFFIGGLAASWFLVPWLAGLLG